MAPILAPILQSLATQLLAHWWVIPLAIAALYLKTPSGKGALGELIVNVSARLLLDRTEYHLIRNVTLPTEDGTTQIDHIIVSRFGVFVIETKNYRGWIFGTPQQKTWTQKFPGSSHKFQNPLHQNYKHVRTLGKLLQLDGDVLHSLIVFVGNSTFKTPMPDNVTAAGGYIRFIKSKTLPVLSAEEVNRIKDKVLAGRLEPSRQTDRDHVRHVQQIIESKRGAPPPAAAQTPAAPSAVTEASAGLCPKCGSMLVYRTIKTGAKAGEQFIGCIAFPACRHLELRR